MLAIRHVGIKVYQHFSQNSVDNEISTDFSKQSLVFMDQFQKEMSRKTFFYLYAYPKKITPLNIAAKNYFHTMPKYQAISSFLYQSLRKERNSISHHHVIHKICGIYFLWNGPHFAHLRICDFSLFLMTREARKKLTIVTKVNILSSRSLIQ